MRDGAELPPSDGLTARLTGFVAALREFGLQVGPAETVDAARSIAVLGLADREHLRHGLAASLIRREGSRRVFDTVFDLYFPAATGARTPAGEAPAAESSADPVAALRAQLAGALAAGDEQRLRDLAATAVELLGRAGDAGDGQGAGWSALRVLDHLQAQTLIAGAARRRGEVGDDFEARLVRDEVRRLVGDFGELVRAEARRRSAEVRGRDQVARWSPPPVTELDFLAANRSHLAELRRTVQPLARRLASRLAARRRRARHGVIDVRRTFRRSLSTGGVPMEPAYRQRHAARPEIVLLCDVSGSVAGFANFTLMLVEALHDQFSRVRAFAFVDSVDEVTDLVADNDADPAGLAGRILAGTRVASGGGHSDYAHVLRQFATEYEDVVGPRTSVLVLGDARSNGGDAALPALAAVLARARHAYWLNPEPRRSWGTGDSLALTYRTVIEMHECRTAQQLTEVISKLLPI